MRRALGKGLSQLFGDQVIDATNEVPIGSIVPNQRQPRTVFDDSAIAELSESIKVHGILQPLLVRAISPNEYELIAGERRLRAAKAAGLESVPVIVRSAGEQGSLELALIENIQREDISAMEAARAFRKLIDEFALTQDDVADKVGKSRAAIANTLRLLRLPKTIQQALESGKISEGHARALLQVGDSALQLALLAKILEKQLSVRETEMLARQVTDSTSANQDKGKRDKKAARKVDAIWLRMEEGIAEKLGAPVKVERQGKGGRIVVDFYSDEDLSRILDVLEVEL